MTFKGLSLILLATSLLLGGSLSSPALAQNALTRPVASEQERDTRTPLIVNGETVFFFSETHPVPSSARIAYDETNPGDMHRHLESEPFNSILLEDTCVPQLNIKECSFGLTPEMVTFFNTTKKRHQIKLFSAEGFFPFGVSAPAMLQLETPAGCQYAPPGVTVTELKPIGHSVQGENPIVTPSGMTQATRIYQLRAWGYKIEWQHIGNGKLFLMGWCIGVPQN